MRAVGGDLAFGLGSSVSKGGRVKNFLNSIFGNYGFFRLDSDYVLS